MRKTKAAPSVPTSQEDSRETLEKHWQASHLHVAPVPCHNNNYCCCFIHVVLLMLLACLLLALNSIGARGQRIWALSKTG